MLCFSSSLSAKWHPSGGQKDGSWGRLNHYCREDEGRQSAVLLQLPPLCPDWHCLAGKVLHSYYCLPQPFKFIVLTSPISAHFALNWLWHISPRIILNQHVKLALVCCHCRGRSATVGIVSSALFTALQTTDPRSELTSVAPSSACFSGISWISVRLEPSIVRNSINSLCLLCMPTTSPCLHSCYVEHWWQTGAVMIVVELDSVTIWWVRQETLPAATFKRKK